MHFRMKMLQLALLCVYATPSHEEATSSLFRPSGIRRHKSSELISICRRRNSVARIGLVGRAFSTDRSTSPGKRLAGAHYCNDT